MSGNEVQATDIEVGFSPKFDTPEFQEAVRQSSHHTTMLWVGLATTARRAEGRFSGRARFG